MCMRFHKTDIVIAKPSGEVVVTSGGYKTKTTFQSVSEGLEPMGIILRSSRGEVRHRGNEAGPGLHFPVFGHLSP